MDGVGGSVLARLADEFTAGCFREFGNPQLRMNDGLAPLLAEDARAGSGGDTRAYFGDCVLHIRYNSGCALRFAKYAGDERNVGVDVSEFAGRKQEHRDRGLENLDDRFFLVGNRCDYEVGADGADLFGLRGP